MVKFMGKFLFLPLYLNLFIGIALAEPNIEQDNGATLQSQGQVEDFTNVVGVRDGHQSQYNGETQENFNSELDNSNFVQPNGIGKQENSSGQEIDSSIESNVPVKEDNTFHNILSIIGVVLGVLNAVGLFMLLLWNTNKFKRLEMKLGKITENFNQLKNSLQQLKHVSNMEEHSRTKPVNSQISSSKNTGGKFVEVFQQNTVENSRSQNFASNTPIQRVRSEYDAVNNNSTVTTSFTNKRSSESVGIQEITLDFNEMMKNIANTPGLGSQSIKQKFVKDHRIIAFKCINFERRVNNSEPPQFAECMPTESTLWGVPLNDDTLAVFPSLREYEINAHNYGGMKELFESGYRSGSYRKIEIVEPAIMSPDFRYIKRRGKLNLS